MAKGVEEGGGPWGRTADTLVVLKSAFGDGKRIRYAASNAGWGQGA